MISPTTLAPRLADHLPRQRWFGAKGRPLDMVRVVHAEVLKEGWPALYRVEAEVQTGDDTARYQVFLGLRPSGEPCEFLTGHEHAVLGEFETSQGQAMAYDGLLDPELALALVAMVAPEQAAERVRPIGAEQSNSSLVYDDAIILKVFRRLADGPNPEVEVTEALAGLGFPYVADPVAVWRRDGTDLAFAQRYLAGGTEGWAMALTSLRDLYADPRDPAEAGGDLAAESERLGEVTAELHLALAEAFGRFPGRAHDWADLMDDQLKRVLSGDTLAEAAGRVVARLREVGDPGPAIRIHGDYHLGQVMRTDAGWFVLDLEGEPARPLEERSRPSSPLKDVAGMLRSYSYAPAVAMATQAEDLTGVGRAWEARNREAFLAGYIRPATDGDLLPSDPSDRAAVLSAFELDKAVYEVAYEQNHRPEWASIPIEGIRRLLGVVQP